MRSVTPLKQPIFRDVMLPGCIGYTIRALNIAAMTKGSVRVERPLKSDDTYKMVGVLQSLGIAVKEVPDAFVVDGDVSDIRDSNFQIDVGLSGRTARSVLALLSAVPGVKTVTCAEPFKKRPIGDLVEGLRQLGADIMYLEKDGFLPVKISSQRLNPGKVKMPGSLSSQYFSAIMMIAPLVGDITIEVEGEQSSRPFIDMTIGIMKDFGVQVENSDYWQYHIKDGQQYVSPGAYTVEPEATSASYFFAIAALTGSRIRVLGLGPDSLQGDKYFADVLADMGCTVKKSREEQWIEVTGDDSLKGVTVDMNATPDLVPTLAVVAAFAEGKTVITNIAHARIKETDRIESPRHELSKLGVRTEATEDSLTIYGGEPKPATIDTYHDHRMAMAFAVAGTKLPGMVINNPEVVDKSFPNFWHVLDSLADERNVVLIGMRGSGKSTVGKLLAKRLGREFINMDEVLEQRAGMTIPEMVAEHGWDYFRDKEADLAQELTDTQGVVISTGGGVVLRPENVSALKQNGQMVLLDASIDNLEARLREETSGRPALTSAQTLREELQTLLCDRGDLYKNAADIRINTDHLSPEQIVAEITAKTGAIR